MARPSTPALPVLVLLSLGMALPSLDALGQERTVKEQLVGTWAYVSVDNVRADGSREPIYGPNPRGLAVFDGSGHYILMTARTGLLKFASDNRNQGTADENKAVVQGSIAHFGSYTVNEADRTITFHIDTSTFPNWNGADQTRPFTLANDELKWITPASSGGSAEVVLRRAK